MIISIDESGIHKQDGKSVIALVYIEVKDLEATEKLVLQAEQAAGIRGFHWAHRNWRIREVFVREIARANLKVKIAYINNPIILHKATTEALEHLLAERKISQILIDGDKPKAYTRQLKKVLRDKGITVRKIRSVNDESFPVVRIADAVAGLARAAYDSPDGKASKLIKLLEPKVELRIDLK
jgi:hypothetical protein